MRDLENGLDNVLAGGLDAYHGVDLFGHDDDADSGEHAMDDGCRKISIEFAGFKESHQDLKHTGDDDGR